MLYAGFLPKLFNAMRKVNVKLTGKRDDSYPIYIGAGISEKIPPMLPPAHSYALVADRTVRDLYAGQFLENMRKARLHCILITFPPGEKSKSRRVKAKIEDELFENGIGRDGCIIAFGGGVTGDIAGFVAATYMRAIPYVQVPTTLLAMADSSVGGKTGIDVPAGKNLVGAFYQPKAVFIDPLYLESLPKRQVRAGMAEVIKHAVVADPGLFNRLSRNAAELLEAGPDAMEPLLAKNCSIKAGIVSRDEREGNLRQVLNFGHTVGHAMEKLSGYRILHGEAVAAGMAVEVEIARRMKLISAEEAEKITGLLKKFRFSLRLPENADIEDFPEAMRLDKKSRKQRLRMALPEKIGKIHKAPDGQWTVSPPMSVVRAALKKFSS